MSRRFSTTGVVFAFHRHCIGLLRQPSTTEFSAWLGDCFFLPRFLIRDIHNLHRSSSVTLCLYHGKRGRLFYRCGRDTKSRAVPSWSQVFSSRVHDIIHKEKEEAFFITGHIENDFWSSFLVVLTFDTNSYWKRATGSTWEQHTGSSCFFTIITGCYFFRSGSIHGKYHLFGRRSAKT